MSEIIQIFDHHIAHYGVADLVELVVAALDVNVSRDATNGQSRHAKALAELAENLIQAKDKYCQSLVLVQPRKLEIVDSTT